VRVVITGGSGFVGRHLHEHLTAEGDTVLPFGPPEPGFLDVLDRPAVFAAMASARPEGVYHLAGFSHVGDSFAKPVETIRVNVEGTLNILDACREARVERVLLVGSSEEYGDIGIAGRPLLEEDVLRPLSPYGASKVAAEFLGLQAHLGHGLATIMTRSFNHTGPGQSTDFVVPAMARRIARAERQGARTIQVGSLEAVREFNDVRDIVRAYRLLMLRGRVGDI
jgi:GDP-4-dehydro-6-deoxy-D-mannose reductase